MADNPVAQVYADALFALGQEGGGDEGLSTDLLSGELERFVELLRTHQDLKVFLEAPGISIAKKKEVADVVLGDEFSQTFRNFVCVLIDKRRIGLGEGIRRAIQDMVDEGAKRIRGNLISAVELPAEQVAEIAKLVASRTGNSEVLLKPRVDPSILGGIIIQFGDTYIDGSVQNRLDIMRHNLQAQGGLL